MAPILPLAFRSQYAQGSSLSQSWRSRGCGSFTTLHSESISIVVRFSAVYGDQAGWPFAAGRPVLAKVLHISLILCAALMLSGLEMDIKPAPPPLAPPVGTLLNLYEISIACGVPYLC